MIVQRPQHSSRIGTAAAHACLTGDALCDADLQTVGVPADGVQIELCGFPGQIGLIGGNAGLIAFQHPGFAGTHINFNIVPDGHGLHDAFQIMIAILPLAQHIQRQIQFGKCALIKCCHIGSSFSYF